MKLLICAQAIDKNHPILGFFCGWVAEFAKHFDEVHVICLEKGEYDLPPHVHVYSLGKEEGERRLKYLYRFYKHFWHIFFTVRIDYVFFHMGAVYNILAVPFFLLRKKFGTKFYWWKTHGTINGTGKIALKFVDRVYTASEKSFPIRTGKKNVIGHAIDTENQPRREFVNNRTPVVLFIGRVTPVKKIEVLVDALSKLHGRGILCTLRIVGVCPDAEYRQKLDTYVRVLHVEDIVTFVGPKKHTELGEEFANADVVVNPSETGGIDKVVLEAMSHGIPVIALAAVYGDLLSSSNLSVSVQDSSLYADRIAYVFAHPDELGELSLKLQKIVSEGHSLSTLTKRIFNI